MAIRRLFNMFNNIGAAGELSILGLRFDAPGGVRPATSQGATFAIRAAVQSVEDDGYQIAGQSRQVFATPATDEPLQVGQTVWAAKSAEGHWFTLGSAKR